MNRFLIQIIYQEVFQEQRILWRICLIAKHSFYFLGRTVVVPLVVPLERSFEHILADIYRLVPSICTGNLDDDEVHIPMLGAVYMVFKQNIIINFLMVV